MKIQVNNKYHIFLVKYNCKVGLSKCKNINRPISIGDTEKIVNNLP